MGQKVHPKGFRVGVIRDWDSKWYADKKDFSKFLVEDYNIRKFINSKLYNARISDIVIERKTGNVYVTIYAAKPGMIIGKAGSLLEELKKDLLKLTESNNVNINVIDIKRPDLDAQVVSENIAAQLERRVAFRKAMKQAMQKARRAGAKGIKVAVSGRLAGADMARTEFYKEGNVPLQTIRADIDYGFAEADTTYGKMGVKVWIFKGEILEGRVKLDSDGKSNNSNRKNNRRNNNKRRNNENNENKTPKKDFNKEVKDGNNSEEN